MGVVNVEMEERNWLRVLKYLTGVYKEKNHCPAHQLGTPKFIQQLT